MTTTPNAGSAAGIDLADVRNLPMPDNRYHAEFRRGYSAALVNVAALARATPQPSADRAPEWRNCRDCDGSGRIGPDELCSACQQSGILPGADRAPADGAGERAPARALPDGWIALSIQYNGREDETEEVAYGPKHMMDRLGKWLDRHFARVIADRDAAAPTAGDSATPQPVDQKPVAYLHQVVAGDGEPDEALSFAPDNFPLAGTLGYRSVGYRPLYDHPATPQHSVAEQASIGDDPEFHKRLGQWRAAVDYYQSEDADPVMRDWNALIEHIDGRAQPLASTAATQPEQASELAIGVSNNDLGVHINIMQRHADGKVTVLHAAEAPAGDSFARVAFAQPLASTAATQPEQASIKTWQERCGDTGPTPSLDEAARAMKAEIADLRAALAIPASTAPTQPEKPTCKTCYGVGLIGGTSLEDQEKRFCPDCIQASTAAADNLLGEILVLAESGMCHGLLADDYCSQIVAKLRTAGASTAASEQQAGALELAARLRDAHRLEVWDWDYYLIAADMLEKLAATPDIATTAADQQDAAQAQAGDDVRCKDCGRTGWHICRYRAPSQDAAQAAPATSGGENA